MQNKLSEVANNLFNISNNGSAIAIKKDIRLDSVLILLKFGTFSTNGSLTYLQLGSHYSETKHAYFYLKNIENVES